jgi:YbbR domain-containing protein
MKNKVLTFLLSLAISFGLWLYVVTVISPESESVFYDIPVELVGKDYLNNQNLMVVSPVDNLRVDLTLSGNRSDLKKLNSSNITVIADLSKITYAGEHRLDCSASFASGAVEVMEQKPDYITVVVAEKLTKDIPVKVNFIGSVPDGYEEDRKSVSMDHTMVTVTGPKETVEKISYAGITVDLTGEMTTFVYDYALVLCGADNRPVADVSFVNTNLSTVRAVVQVNRVKEVPLKFELDFTDSGLDQSMVTVYPMVESVTLIGDDQSLQKVEDVFTFTIVLKNYTEDHTETFLPVLPDGVVCTEAILVHIQIPEMESRWFVVDQFVYQNQPEGMNLQVIDYPAIEIWGPCETLDKLTSEQIQGIVDCSVVVGSPSYAPVMYVIADYEYLLIRVDRNNSYIAVHHVEE